MSLKIGIENGAEGRTIAWVLEHPGCTSYGENREGAILNLPAALQEYDEWLGKHGQETLKIALEQEFVIEETWEVYQIADSFEPAADGYEVNAWFRHDWKPLSTGDIARGLSLLSWSREDLLETIEGLGQAILDEKQPGERWSINGILKHIAGSEWWYLDRLGLAFGRGEVPSDPGERLVKVRSQLEKVLPGTAGSKQVIGVEGEFWSPRKVLRRALWHERDHIAHIRKLLSQ